jgi:DNA-binding NarL/FixJ family response regulator
MREFIIADNQDITKAGMMFLLGRQKDTSLLLEADNKAELIQQLRLHPTAVVILDYTLFDFSRVLLRLAGSAGMQSSPFRTQRLFFARCHLEGRVSGSSL